VGRAELENVGNLKQEGIETVVGRGNQVVLGRFSKGGAAVEEEPLCNGLRNPARYGG